MLKIEQYKLRHKIEIEINENNTPFYIIKGMIIKAFEIHPSGSTCQNMIDEYYNKMLTNEAKEIIELEKKLAKKHNKELIEKEIITRENKKYITISDFKEIYNISISSQQQFRGRLNDPLPYHQKMIRGKVTYIVEEVEKWFQNQYK